MIMSEGYVRTWTKDSVATIEFFHPASNSLPSSLLQQLTTSIKEVGQSSESSVIILKSGGERAFCAGASFDELASITNEADGKAFFSGFANVINAMRLCPKFIVGRVHGKTVGGGVGLIAATDYCLATHNAAVKLSELTVGIGPFVIEPAVKRKIGLAATSHLTINATAFESAIWAWQKGLYNDVYQTPEKLDEHVAKMVKQLASFDPAAMRHMKEVLWEGTEHWDKLLNQRAAISGKLVLTEFTQKTLAALKSK
jgi:methylglutaconyl-CoA hydratase